MMGCKAKNATSKGEDRVLGRVWTHVSTCIQIFLFQLNGNGIWPATQLCCKKPSDLTWTANHVSSRIYWKDMNVDDGSTGSPLVVLKPEIPFFAHLLAPPPPISLLHPPAPFFFPLFPCSVLFQLLLPFFLFFFLLSWQQKRLPQRNDLGHLLLHQHRPAIAVGGLFFIIPTAQKKALQKLAQGWRQRWSLLHAGRGAMVICKLYNKVARW